MSPAVLDRAGVARAIIDQHITRHGPWAPFTPEGCLAFLTRTGRPYTLVIGSDAPPTAGKPASAIPPAALDTLPPDEA